MDDVENQGLIEIESEEMKDFETIKDTLEAYFGPIDEGASWIKGITWGKKYFYSVNPLYSPETLSREKPEQHCYPVPYVLSLENGVEINLYDVEE